MVDYTSYLPEFDGSMIFGVLTWFILIIVGGILVGIGSFFLIKRMKFNKKIIIFEKIGGKFEQTKIDRAITIRFGESGDSVIYCAKSKKHLPTPSIQTGRNIYWYAIREDGEWINIGIEDIDLEMKKLKVHYLDKEMRYARVALQRNLKERYQQQSFWSVYGGLVAYTSLIVITGVMFWLLIGKFVEIGSEVTSIMNTAKEIMKESRDVIAAVDNLKHGGSGLIPAG